MALSRGFADSEIFLGHPYKVYWNAWESNTRALQNSGWKLSAYQSFERRQVSLAIQSKDSYLTLMAESFLSGSDYIDNISRTRLDFRVVQVLAEGSRIVHIQPIDFRMFEPVDARPTMMSQEEAWRSDLIAFAPLLPVEKEIIVAPQSVQQILDDLLRQQEPNQAEIRSRRKREDQSVQIHAQILSFGT